MSTINRGHNPAHTGAALLCGVKFALTIKECREADEKPYSHILTDLRFHDLRHEATSRLASVFPMHELTKITGHRDPRMLMRYYHPRAEELAKRLA